MFVEAGKVGALLTTTGTMPDMAGMNITIGVLAEEEFFNRGLFLNQGGYALPY
jgi:hypothetical protein